MAPGKRTLSPEFRAEAVKLVIDSSRPSAQVARELGIGEATLGRHALDASRPKCHGGRRGDVQ